MTFNKTALIVEGGGLRGVYTAGVLRWFMERGFYLPYVIGVSSGACNCANYISRQKERSRIVNIDFITDPRYISYSRWLIRGELFGMRFLFDTLPNRLAPFDYDTFFGSTQRFLITVTECISGKALYMDRHTSRDRFLDVLRASCSLPLMSHPVHLDGRVLMDGGIADSVPIGKSIEDGNRKHILILTQPKGYRKKPNRFAGVVALRYRRFPGLCRAVATRHRRYNATMDTIDAMQRDGKAFVIRPEQRLIVGRVERNQGKLSNVYGQGYADARKAWETLCDYVDAAED